MSIDNITIYAQKFSQGYYLDSLYQAWYFNIVLSKYPVMEISNSNGETIQIDEEDLDLVKFNGQWYIFAMRQGERRSKYARVKIKGKMYTLSRLILERKLGRMIKPGLICDHKNRDTYDNRRENLREVTFSENAYNRPPRCRIPET